MRDINKIIIHCSFTPKTMDIGVEEIRKWHLERGWSDIGYHYVIRRDGTVETGRPVEKPGAHCKGHNQDSIGICLAGGKGTDGKPFFNFSQEQLRTLEDLLEGLWAEYPFKKGEWIYGHNDFSTKPCPCFDVKEWFYGT